MVTIMVSRSYCSFVFPTVASITYTSSYMCVVSVAVSTDSRVERFHSSNNYIYPTGFRFEVLCSLYPYILARYISPIKD